MQALCVPKMYRPPHHEKIHRLVLEIVNTEDAEAERLVYNEIKEICETHENTVLDHPFQWETLGDFTYQKPELALNFYFKALKLASDANLAEYVASINLAIAEQYFEMANFSKAKVYASSANDVAKSLSNLELRQEISEILLKTSQYT